MREFVTYEMAFLGGLVRYFDGVPCRRGHVADRYTDGRQCVECLRLGKIKRRLSSGKPRLDRLVVTKLFAMGVGLPHYWDGKPCDRQHTGWKRVVDGACLECDGGTTPYRLDAIPCPRGHVTWKDEAGHCLWCLDPPL